MSTIEDGASREIREGYADIGASDSTTSRPGKAR
jgi:hypothetical protein